MAVTSRPARAMVPPKRRVTPTIDLIRVVLPVPLRPSSASTWPSARLNDILGSTTASPYPARRSSITNSSDIGALAEIDRLDARIASHLVWRTLHQHGAGHQHRN